MLKEKYQEQLNSIVNLLDYYIDGVYDLENEEDFEPMMEEFRQRCPYKCYISNGATKGVIVFRDLGFVIKTPLIYNCGGEEIYGAGGDHDWDYCEAEVENYIAAQEYGVDKCFAQIEYINSIGDTKHPIYIQEYVETIGVTEEMSSHTDEDINTVREIINQSPAYDYIDTNWEADLLASYGRKFYEKIKEFIYRQEINDLHKGNIGYNSKMPILLDYSGYHAW